MSATDEQMGRGCLVALGVAGRIILLAIVLPLSVLIVAVILDKVGLL